jgi:hypothetical protein
MRINAQNVHTQFFRPLNGQVTVISYFLSLCCILHHFFNPEPMPGVRNAQVSDTTGDATITKVGHQKNEHGKI